MWLTRISVNNPVFAAMMMFFLMVVGLASTQRMGVEEFPNVDFPFVVVYTTYPGASPEIVETDVTKKIEDEINTIAGVKEVFSISQEGLSQVIVQFNLGIASDLAAQKVRDKIALVKTDFRDDIADPLIEQYNPAASPVVSVTFQSTSMSMRDLSTYLDETIVKRLQTVAGVGRLSLLGSVEHQVRIALKPAQMTALNVSVNDVLNTLKTENMQIPVGTLDQGNNDLVVQIEGRLTSIAQFNQLIVSNRANAPIRLGQVADISDNQAETDSAALQDGKAAVAMDVIRTSDANIIDVVDKTKAELAEIQKILPTGVTMTVVADSAKSIRASLNNVTQTLIEGACLAILIVLLFLGSWRSTVITSLTLPISLLGTMAVIWAFGFTINMMTLMALSLCIGLLIDDAIVVRENIVRHTAMGKGHKQAALAGTKEIGLAVLATTLVIVAVFLPVAFMEGIIGQFFYQFGVTVSAAVLLSMFVSFTLDPMLSSIWPEPPQHKRNWFGRQLDKFQILLDKLTLLYSKLLNLSLRFRLITMLVAIGSLVAAFGLAGLIGKEFVPIPDLNEMAIKVETPVDASLNYSQQKAAQIDAVLRQYPEVTSTYTSINSLAYSGKNKIHIRAQLLPKAERQLGLNALISSVRQQLQQIGGIQVTSVASANEAVTGGLKPIRISIKGPELDKLQEISDQFMQQLANIDGLVDLESSLKQPKPTLTITINRAAASDAGLSVGQIGMALRPLLAGDNITTFKDSKDNNLDVNLRLADNARQRVEQLKALYISSAKVDPNTGLPLLIPLSQVASFTQELGASQINRRALFREAMVEANTEGRPAGDIGDDIKAVQADFKLPPGYSFQTEGSNKDMEESIGYAISALILAIVFIYMLLGSQFNSFIYPVAIMASLPLSLVGVFLSLFLFQSTLNIFSIIGIIMLMGLVCKNAILLIDFIKQSLAEGNNRHDAIIKAGETRLRPILMTTTAMVMGMVPLALGIGEGSEQQAPMAHAIIGGVITSTLLTLVVVPVIYTYLDDLKKLMLHLVKKFV